MYEKEIKKAIRNCMDDVYFKFRDTYRIDGYTYDVWLVEVKEDLLEVYCDGWKKAIERKEEAERELEDCSFRLDMDGNYCDSATDYYSQQLADAEEDIRMYSEEAESQLEDLFGKLDEDLHDILTAD